MKAKRHGKQRILTEDLISLYVVSLKTLEEIGTIAGMTKQGVLYVLKQSGVEYKGGKVDKICKYCGSSYKYRRDEVREGRGLYCSVGCFAAHRSLHGDMSVSSRFGRAAIALAGIKLNKGEVVHHVDGDRNNNDLSNLRIFSSQSEHMKYHHKLREGLEATGGVNPKDRMP